MSENSNPVIVIPARMGSRRLPGKPLLDIAGAPMIVQVWRRAVEAELGPVLVACAEAEIAAAVEAAGGRALMTDPDLPSGSDRVFAALEAFDPKGAHDVVVNLQGDLPTVAPADIRAATRSTQGPASTPAWWRSWAMALAPEPRLMMTVTSPARGPGPLNCE